MQWLEFSLHLPSVGGNGVKLGDFCQIDMCAIYYPGWADKKCVLLCLYGREFTYTGGIARAELLPLHHPLRPLAAK